MIVRVNKSTDYTTMSNFHLKDRRLTLKAKGLLSVVLSLSPDWKYSIAGLASISKEKETSIKTALEELKENGYFVITKKMPNETKTGRIEYEWDFYERPINEKQEVKKQEVENLPLENLMLENQGQLNTNISITDELNTNSMELSPISPCVASKDEKLNLLFEEFWKEYPKKVNKKNALREFKKKKDIEAIMPTILADLEYKKRSKDWTKDNGQYIPYPERYIKNERWNDVNEVAERQSEIESKCANELEGFF